MCQVNQQKQRFHKSCLFVQVIILLIFSPVMAQNNTVELKYDDGNYNLKLTLLIDATSFTTRFTPPAQNVKIEKIRFYVPDTTKGNSCLLYIYDNVADEPGTVIYGPVPVTVAQIGWNEYDLSQENISVNRDFYISLWYDQKTQLTIAAEDHAPLSGRTYDTDC